MKYFFIALFLIPFTVLAQFSKGTVAIGGSVYFQSVLHDPDNSDMPSSKYLTVNPYLGVFVTPTFAMGGFVQLLSDKVPSINIYTNRFEERKVVSGIYGVFARKYFPISDKFLFGVQGEVGLGNKVIDGDSDNKTKQFTAALAPLFTFLPHPKWAFNASFAELSYEKNSPGSYYSNSNNFTARIGGLGLGINYFMGGKQE